MMASARSTRAVVQYRCLPALRFFFVCCSCTLFLQFPVFAKNKTTLDPFELEQEFKQNLLQLADRCQDQGLLVEARTTHNWLIHRDPNRQYFFPPASTPPRPLAAETTSARHEWHERFLQLRRQYAAQLFQLIQQSLTREQAFEAFRLLYEVLRQNPDHADARRILGYVQIDGLWRTPFAARLIDNDNVDHPQFGWLPSEHVARYEAGERYFRNRWISADQEQRRRASISQGWRIETEHYLVKTNHSLETGVALGRQLENLYTIWRQLFVGFYTTNEILARRIRGDNIELAPRRKFKVVFFRDQSEYVRELKKYQPKIELTLGIYLGRQRTAYFYAGSRDGDKTLYHEATHQLFHESHRGRHATRDEVGLRHNFWIIEGIALYMESIQQHADFLTVGGVESGRLQYARHNVLCGNFFVPLEQLVSLGRIELQTDDRIRLFYSQAAGLTHFLMDGEAGHYRNSLVDFIRTVYNRVDQPSTLAQFCGQSYAALDAGYRQFLDVDDADLLDITKPQGMYRLLLGRTAVTDIGLQRLDGANQLRDLNLDGTAITDQALQVIGNLHHLEELDLSATRISDNGLRHLKNLDNLKILWLSGTPVTNEGLVFLTGLKSLQQLHVARTRITTEGLKLLSDALPSLRINHP
jgi:hypothetical protein